MNTWQEANERDDVMQIEWISVSVQLTCGHGTEFHLASSYAEGESHSLGFVEGYPQSGEGVATIHIFDPDSNYWQNCIERGEEVQSELRTAIATYLEGPVLHNLPIGPFITHLNG
jgi:hypothetical protein